MAEGDPGEGKILQFRPRKVDLMASVTVEANRELLRTIGVLAKGKGMSIEHLHSLALEEGVRVVLEDFFGRDIISRDRVDGSEVVIYKAPVKKPSA
ncbi:MAG TPA: hypothetical protein VMR59_00840 [Patescibacteria group bacterium]|jgi:hypothetical protein|nr:hypothetical protein [Patescibacteria group bacterium]